MIKFEYDKNGKLIAYKDGEKVGAVETMGDEARKDPEDGDRILEQIANHRNASGDKKTELRKR